MVGLPCRTIRMFSKVFLVCIQESFDKDPFWLEGHCMVTRSPVAHIGDGGFDCPVISQSFTHSTSATCSGDRKTSSGTTLFIRPFEECPCYVLSRFGIVTE